MPMNIIALVAPVLGEIKDTYYLLHTWPLLSIPCKWSTAIVPLSVKHANFGTIVQSLKWYRFAIYGTTCRIKSTRTGGPSCNSVMFLPTFHRRAVSEETALSSGAWAACLIWNMRFPQKLEHFLHDLPFDLAPWLAVVRWNGEPWVCVHMFRDLCHGIRPYELMPHLGLANECRPFSPVRDDEKTWNHLKHSWSLYEQALYIKPAHWQAAAHIFRAMKALQVLEGSSVRLLLDNLNFIVFIVVSIVCCCLVYCSEVNIQWLDFYLFNY